MPYITSIGLAVPENRFEQQQIADFMANALQLDATNQRKLKALYRSTKIQYRHSVLADYGKQLGSFDFYPNTPDLEPFPTTSQRMQAYRQYGLPLAISAAQDCLGALPNAAITHIITVSCTGLYAPGLDIELVQALGLAGSTQRTAINFMGCYGAFNGLKVAQAIVKADPKAQVLVLCLELCTLHFQKIQKDDYLLSNALFADGAAAVLVEANPRQKALALSNFICELMPQGKQDMAWQVADHGFEMILSSYIPNLVKSGIKALTDKLLDSNEVFDFYAIHPGGRAILEGIEQAIGLSKDDNRFAYQVLADYGNMSSCTVIFVLQKLWQTLQPEDHQKQVLSCAFGPGLTLETMKLGVHFNQKNED
jgi:predicted naringenin-chalcone synthase